MTPEELERAISERGLQPLYLVLGEEHVRREQTLGLVKRTVLEGGVPGLNDDQMTAGDVTLSAVLSAARTLPMMAKRRLVVVRGVERWEGATQGQAAGALDALAEYAAAPSPTTTLVLVATKLDKRRRLVTLAKKAGYLVSCDALSPRDVSGWIRERARARGASLSSAIADLLVELLGSDLSALADAIDRLSLYAGEGAPISEETVFECLVRVPRATVWELVGAVGRRDAGAALRALHAVYDPQDRGLRLLGLLAWSTRQLLKFESAIRSGASPAEAAQRAGAPPFKAAELRQQVRRLPKQELEGWLESLSDVDLALKGGSRRPPRAVLEHLLLGMCRSRAGA